MASTSDGTAPAPCLDPGYCFVCQRSFNGTRGLASHKGKKKCAQPIQQNDVSSRNQTGPSTASLHLQISSVRKQITIIRRIPKAARFSAAQLLRDLLEKCISNEPAAWRKLMLFAYQALQVPSKSKVSFATAVKRNITAFETDKLEIKIKQNQKKSKTKTPAEKVKKNVENRIQDGDIRGAFRALVSDESIAPPDAATLRSLEEKHPLASVAPFPDLPNELPEFPPITAGEVINAVRSFPNGSAGGLDGIKPQHLKDLLAKSNGDMATQLCDSLVRFLNAVVRGAVPTEVCPFLYGASLTPLLKKDGGIRPIACGGVFRRILCKIVSVRVQLKMGTLLKPTQLGYGTLGGAEASVHSARAFLSAEESLGCVLLKLDFRNAFNCVHRQRILAAAVEHIPEYASFIWQLYRDPSHLLYREHVIPSQRGAQQGDPLGPLLFCLAIHPLVSKLKSTLNLWYLDDGTLAGRPEVVLADLKTVVDSEQELGLRLNFAKCELFHIGGDAEQNLGTLEAFGAVAPGLQTPDSASLTLLGAPLTDEAVGTVWDAKCAENTRLGKALEILEPHHAFYLLRSCLFVPKVMYVMRCSSVWRYPEMLKKFDCGMRESLEKIANVAMDDRCWKRASLPVRKGGLGTRSSEGVALSAFLASTHSAALLVETIFPAGVDGLTDLAVTEWTRRSGSTVPPLPLRGHQRSWDEPLVDLALQSLLVLLAGDQRACATLLAACQKLAGAWLHALPAATLGTFLDRSTLRIALALRLGSPVCSEHTCRCGSKVEPLGTHGLSCKYSAGRSSRHTEISNLIQRGLCSAGFPSVREPVGLSRADGKRPDGQTLIPFEQGRSLVWDFTTTDTLAATNLEQTSKQAGKAAEQAETRKRNKYAFLGGLFHFVPVAVETLGSVGPAAEKLFGRIGSLIGSNLFEPRSSAYFLQRVSLALQRGNAACVFGTIPTSKRLDEIYYVL